ncbi:MAG: FAD-binding oxidoreductase [Pararhodobacter sp.]|nr:FAD-binding oxidoreductase [Pararhodobacter sp.]
MNERTSISGRNTLDWDVIAAALDGVELIREPVLVKKRSRDFFWYSPILNRKLKACFGDLVARPANADQMARCLAVAHAHDAPLVLRGGGTGNYGQSVPLDGGLIIDTTAMNRVLEIGTGFVRAEAGALMADINAALADSGQELAMFPSTQDIATIGGFVAGGSGGIGSVAHGMLRDPGNLIALSALSVEAAPRLHRFDGADALHIHHAWGLNGAITDVTVRTVPLQEWIGCIASFDCYTDAYAAGYALASDRALGCKLLSVVDARIGAYFPRLKGHVRDGADLLVAMVPAEGLDRLRAIVVAQGGAVDIALDEPARKAAGLPHVFEFSYNHTTLQVLKSDRSATYQQIGVPDAADVGAIARVAADLGKDVWQHHEFARRGGEVVSFDLPIIWYHSDERLAEINAIYEAHGFPVYDAHAFHVEGGGLKNADYRHLAWKKRMDPKGLMNSGKSLAWPQVRDLPADEIERMARKD